MPPQPKPRTPIHPLPVLVPRARKRRAAVTRHGASEVGRGAVEAALPVARGRAGAAVEVGHGAVLAAVGCRGVEGGDGTDERVGCVGGGGGRGWAEGGGNVEAGIGEGGVGGGGHVGVV